MMILGQNKLGLFFFLMTFIRVSAISQNNLLFCFNKKVGSGADSSSSVSPAAGNEGLENM